MPMRRARWPGARAHDPAHARVTTLGEEKRVNAFLRLQNPEIIARLRETISRDRRTAGCAHRVREAARAAQPLVASPRVRARAMMASSSGSIGMRRNAPTLVPPVLPVGTRPMNVPAAAPLRRNAWPKNSRKSRARHAQHNIRQCTRTCSRVDAWPSTCARSRCRNASRGILRRGRELGIHVGTNVVREICPSGSSGRELTAAGRIVLFPVATVNVADLHAGDRGRVDAACVDAEAVGMRARHVEGLHATASRRTGASPCRC